MKNRERFIAALNFQKPADRLPMIEWATWWDKTLVRWHGEGMPQDVWVDEASEYFKLDNLQQFWLRPRSDDYPELEHGQGLITDMESYEEAKKYLFPKDAVQKVREKLLKLAPLHQDGDVVVWITLEGFFWFPRSLFGIENHFYAFYDEPELMHKINDELTDYHIGLVEEFCKILKPDFMTFAEDMSYNHGPMLSHELFKEFLLPYYKRIIPVLKKYGIVPLIDTDGQVEPMIPWLVEAGIEGVLPLERQAGVDVERIRKSFPQFKMVGAYDKMVMSKGEEAMRGEFERLLPTMKNGGYIPSCDHQTPPEVSLENYRIYRKLLEEYCTKAAK